MIYDIGRMSNRATAKQKEFLKTLLNERVWAGLPQHEMTIRNWTYSGEIDRLTASSYIAMHLRAPRKRA